MSSWQTFELSILDFLARLHTPLLDKLMPWISFLGNSGWIWIVIAHRSRILPLGGQTHLNTTHCPHPSL